MIYVALDGRGAVVREEMSPECFRDGGGEFDSRSVGSGSGARGMWFGGRTRRFRPESLCEKRFVEMGVDGSSSTGGWRVGGGEFSIFIAVGRKGDGAQTVTPSQGNEWFIRVVWSRPVLVAGGL